MKKIYSWILMAGGVALAAGGAAGHLDTGSHLHGYAILLVVAGAVLAVVGFFLGREVRVAQQTTVMMKQKQKRHYQIVFRVVLLAAAAVVGYLLIAYR